MSRVCNKEKPVLIVRLRKVSIFNDLASVTSEAGLVIGHNGSQIKGALSQVDRFIPLKLGLSIHGWSG